MDQTAVAAAELLQLLRNLVVLQPFLEWLEVAVVLDTTPAVRTRAHRQVVFHHLVQVVRTVPAAEKVMPVVTAAGLVAAVDIQATVTAEMVPGMEDLQGLSMDPELVGRM